MKKRIVSFLMALVMAVSLLPVQVFAEAVDAAEDPAVAIPEAQIDEKQQDDTDIKDDGIQTYEGIKTYTFNGQGMVDNDNSLPVITSSITAGADKKTITKTYLITTTASEIVKITNEFGNNVATAKFLYAKSNSTTKWKKQQQRSVPGDFDNDVVVTEEDLRQCGFNADFSNGTLTSGNTYYFFAIYLDGWKNGENFAVLIQRQGKVEALTDEQKKPLTDLLATVTGENERNWYQSVDRYNAKTKATSTKGFWTEFTAANGPRATAQKALETATTEAEINAATAALQAAIDNLIPTSQLNPTELYEGLENFKGYTDEFLEMTFTENSAVRFKAKLAEAEEYLNSLFDDNGNPTAENVPENQSTADGYIKAVSAALVNKEDLAKEQDNVKIVNALLKQCPTANNGVYTEDSWNAFVAARDAAKEYFTQYPVTEEGYASAPYPQQHSKLAKQLVNAIQSLTPAAEQITVTLTYTDDYHLRAPDNKITDPACNKPGTRTVTLASGATIANLLEKTGYDYKNISSSFDGVYHSQAQLLCNCCVSWVYPESCLGFTLPCICWNRCRRSRSMSC